MYFIVSSTVFFFFFFNDTATTEIYTLSLHDALPILFLDHPDLGLEERLLGPGDDHDSGVLGHPLAEDQRLHRVVLLLQLDRKSTRLNSSHGYISYAVFCLKKKKKK